MDIVPIEDEGYHLFVRARLMGVELTLVLDTGASMTLFDKSRLLEKMGREAVGLEGSGRMSVGLGTRSMPSEVTGLLTLELHGLIVENYRGGVLELSHINESYDTLGMPGIDGVLGNDLLVRYHARIDYGEGILVLQE